MCVFTGVYSCFLQLLREKRPTDEHKHPPAPLYCLRSKQRNFDSEDRILQQTAHLDITKPTVPDTAADTALLEGSEHISLTLSTLSCEPKLSLCLSHSDPAAVRGAQRGRTEITSLPFSPRLPFPLPSASLLFCLSLLFSYSLTLSQKRRDGVSPISVMPIRQIIHMGLIGGLRGLDSNGKSKYL